MRKTFSLLLSVLFLFSIINPIYAVDVSVVEYEANQIHLKKGEEKTLVFEVDQEIDEAEIEWINSNDELLEIKRSSNRWVITGLNYGSVYLTGIYEGSYRFNIQVQLFDSMVFKTKDIQLDIYETHKPELVFQPAATLDGFDATYVSSDTTIASINESGDIVGHKIGNVTITASYLNQTATKEVEIIDRPDFAYLEPRQTLNVDSSVNILYRTSLFAPNIDKTIEWSSSNENIATVDSRGVVYGIDNGTATITAKVNNKDYKTIVEVISNIEDIEFSEEVIRVAVGEELSVDYKIKPEAYSNTPITWLSSRPSIVRVNNGRLFGISPGEAVVTAKINEIEKDIIVFVDVPLTGITVSPSRISLQQGQRFHVRVQPKPSNSSSELNLTYRSSDEDVVEVDEYGNITAINQGSVVIFIQHGEFTTNLDVTVVPAEDESGQKVIFGSLNSNQIVSFDLRGVDNLNDHILEIPYVNRINRIGQNDVTVILDNTAYYEQTLQVAGLQLNDEYLNKDINLTVIDSNSQRLFNYQLFNFTQVRQNLFPRASLIESHFGNYNGHLIEMEVPISLSRIDKLIVNSKLDLNEEYRIYQEFQESLRLVSATPLDVTEDNVLTLSSIENNFYYLTDQELESRLVMFLFIIFGFIALLTSFFVIKRYNEQEIEFEVEKRSRDESVNFEQQKTEETS